MSAVDTGPLHSANGLLADKIEAAVNRLTLQDILDAEDIKYADVEVPEWGGSVTVQTLTAGKIAEIQKDSQGDEILAGVLLLAAGVSRPTLTAEAAQLIWDTKNADGTVKVLSAIKDLNGIGRTAEQAEHSFQVQG